MEIRVFIVIILLNHTKVLKCINRNEQEEVFILSVSLKNIYMILKLE